MEKKIYVTPAKLSTFLDKLKNLFATKADVENLNLAKDYEQNNENHAEYIKNRPFYTGDPVDTVIMEETTVSTWEPWPDTTQHGANLSIICQLVLGESYTVVWDGTTYENLICFDDDGHKTIGAPYGDYSVYPFGIYNYNNSMSIDDGGNLGIHISSSEFADDNTSVSHTVSIIRQLENIIQLPEKYISYKPGLKVEGKTFTINDEEVIASTGAEIFNDYEYNTATGYFSHAEGSVTTASGYFSHAEGVGTTASGDQSHAEGSDTTASGDYQHVQGKYNIEDTENKYAHIVGNGTYSKRSNIHTVDWEGNAWFARDVYTGGTGQDDPNAKKLATEEYVDTNIKDYFLMKDAVTGSTYVVQIKNGQFTITPKLVKITVTTPPTKTDYTDTELFDPTGMVVMAEYENGTTEEITNYTYDKYVTTGSSEFVIRYTSGGMTYEDSISITTRTIEEALVDFEYTTNDDGTYTITGWKGTYNGVETTECILPNSDLINID